MSVRARLLQLCHSAPKKEQNMKIIFILLCIQLNFAFAQNSPFVKIKLEKDNGNRLCQSGVYIDKNRILTAGHLYNPIYEGRPDHPLEIHIHDIGLVEILVVPGQYIRHNLHPDLCLLQTDFSSSNFISLSNIEPNTSDRLVNYGFRGTGNLQTFNYQINRIFPSLQNNTPVQQYRLSTYAISGQSGGALLLDNKLVGIMSDSDNRNANAIGLQAIKEFLSE